MFFYQCHIALKSIRRNPVISFLIIGGIAMGIGVAMTAITIRHHMGHNPIAHKSHKLFRVQMDSWDPTRPQDSDQSDEPPVQVTYQDAVNLMKSDIPEQQSAMYKSALYIYPEKEGERPFKPLARICFNDFFTMFDVPFRFGGPWSDAADAGPHQVVVLSHDVNDQLFGGEDSIGKMVRIEDREFKVSGVLEPWRPAPKFFDLTNGDFNLAEGIYLPFRFTEPMRLQTMGNTSSWKSYDGFDEKIVSEAVWLQYWVQLSNRKQVEAYKSYLDAYVGEQKKSGRFQRPLNNKLRDVDEWLSFNRVVGRDTNRMVLISLLVLLVCVLNVVGLILGKFLARASEVGVRRALGASKRSIFMQHLVEVQVLGTLGAVLGIGATLLGLHIYKSLGVRSSVLFQFDLPMLFTLVALSLIAAVAAGLFPAWRICNTAPAVHLKIQ